MNTTQSEKLYAQALDFMPGGVNSPVRACRSVGRTPLFIDRAEGSKIYDVDGNEFIDYICSWGPNILGHKQPDVIKAVTSACQNGLTFGACHSGEIELAELIRKKYAFNRNAPTCKFRHRGGYERNPCRKRLYKKG